MTGTVLCDNCQGRGEYVEGMSCVRCNGKGALNLKRIEHLQFTYYPKRLASGSITKQVFEREITTLLKLRTMLGQPLPDIGGTPIGTGPVLLDAVMCAKYGITLDTSVRELKLKFPSIFVEEF